MRVFVTGANGHVGSALVPELLSDGHEVIGLARSDASAATLTAWGAQVRRGDLDDLDCLRQSARAVDGVIHLAFRHDLMRAGDLPSAAATDLAAVHALADALVGTDKPPDPRSGAQPRRALASQSVGDRQSNWLAQRGAMTGKDELGVEAAEPPDGLADIAVAEEPGQKGRPRVA